jgi:prepilin-type N-terminal cleavage/methylation domain-containing protein
MRQSELLRALARRLPARTCEAGFTLIELITVMAILGIVLGALTGLFASASKSESDLNARFQAQEQGRLALDTLRRELHCASAVTTLGDTGFTSGAANGVTYYPGVTATLPAGCSSGSPTVTTYVAWCARTSSVSGRWALWRTSSTSVYSTCPSSGGVMWASQLTTAYLFAPAAQSATQLASTQIYLPVNASSSTSTRTYTLSDTIVLRNSLRQ